MALKWVRCLVQFTRPNDANRRVTHYKGDWLQMRNMEIIQRIANGQVEDPSSLVIPELFVADECGVVTSNNSLVREELTFDLPIARSQDYEQVYFYTLHWNDGMLRKEMLPISFELLKTWEMLVPLEPFSVLAKSIGSLEQRVLTQKVIKDLRVPVYNVDQMYIRRCTATQNLMKAWETERESVLEGPEQYHKGNLRLSFLRSLFVTPLLILALPSSWIVGSHTV